VPSTGGWQTWRTITQNVNLAAGQQTIRLAVKGGGFNLNWFQLESASTPSTQAVAQVQAEAYSAMSGVQVETTSDTGGGSNVGYIDSGDSMTYNNSPVVIDQTGDYVIEFRVASATSGGDLTFEEAGTRAAYTRATFPATGGWQTWTTVSKTVTLTAGTHRFGIYANTGGWNLNWFKISKVVQ
jgi:endoglucanase